MKTMKYNMTFGIALIGVILFTACENFLDSAETQISVENGYGRISISLTGEEMAQQFARTVFPSTAFSKYKYTFTKSGAAGVEKVPGSDGFFTVEAGSYTVAVQAYVGNAEPYTLVATGVSEEFTVSSGSNASVRVPLLGVTSQGKGKFNYTITYPAGAEAEITLQKWPDMNDITLTPNNVTGGSGKTQTLELETGSYLLTVLITKNGSYAGLIEAIHIYPLITTEYSKGFDNSDLLNNFIYQVIATSISIIKYIGSDSAVEIPSSINDIPVTDIEGNAFSGCTGLTSVTIPDSVTNIGNNAFSGCTGLTSITIPDSVTSIGGSAFSGCTGLTSITIPNSVTTIGTDAFSGCTGLTSVTIPDSVTNIGNNAFSGCTGLTSITIPNSVTSIGGAAFSGCTNLRNITIKTSKVTNTKTDNWLTRFPATDMVVTFEDVTSIASNAFYASSANTRLTSVTIGSGVTNIGAEAFSRCEGLTSVIISDRVTTIGQLAFSGYTGLASVTIPNSVTTIGTDAFYGCTGLTSVTVPDSVTTIGTYAFSNCSNLISVTLPTNDNFTTIEGYAFYNCSNLTSITIPASVTTIYGWAFSDCSSLISVKFQSANISISISLSLPGNLKDKYLAGGAGTYTRPNNFTTWTKQ